MEVPDDNKPKIIGYGVIIIHHYPVIKQDEEDPNIWNVWCTHCSNKNGQYMRCDKIKNTPERMMEYNEDISFSRS
jgi:hypothetical protein